MRFGQLTRVKVAQPIIREESKQLTTLLPDQGEKYERRKDEPKEASARSQDQYG